MLLVGFLRVGILDPLAARRGEAPPFFARRRTVQMAIPVVCLALILLRIELSNSRPVLSEPAAPAWNSGRR